LLSELIKFETKEKQKKDMTITTENIWNEFHNELFNFINRKVKDNDTANDILQDIFIKIHLKLDTLTNQDKLTSWLYQITRNSILDYFKKHKPQSEFLDDFFAPIKEQTLDFNNEISPCMLRLINHLPDNYKDAILETELGQLSQKEYAKKSRISYSGAKSRIQRARQQLHLLFKDCCKIQTDIYGNIVDYKKIKQ